MKSSGGPGAREGAATRLSRRQRSVSLAIPKGLELHPFGQKGPVQAVDAVRETSPCSPTHSPYLAGAFLVILAGDAHQPSGGRRYALSATAIPR